MAWVASGSVTVGLWLRKAGAWAKHSDHSVYVGQTAASATPVTISWTDLVDVAAGTGVEAWGITVEDVIGNSATLSNLDISYSATVSSGERSATPSGQTSTVTVTPR